MADPLTYLGLDLPNVGGDGDVWGTKLNAIIEAIDAELAALDGSAGGALPISGGTMTGGIHHKTDTYAPVDLGTLSGTMSVDLSAGNFFYGTAGANYGFAFTNVPTTGKVVFVMLEITNGGAYTPTWPASFKWPGGSPPSLTASGVDLIALYTRDGGTTWRAAMAQEGSA